MKQYRIIAFVGPAGSGKDTIKTKFCEACPNVHEVVRITTRPKRENEVDGVSYIFLDPQTYGDKVINGEVIEATTFRDWFYGTSYESLRSDCLNVGVFDPAGIEQLAANPNIELAIYYISATDKNRLLRQLNRESDPDVREIIRRYYADLEDFANLDEDFDYVELKNNTLEDLNNSLHFLCARYGAPQEQGKND